MCFCASRPLVASVAVVLIIVASPTRPAVAQIDRCETQAACACEPPLICEAIPTDELPQEVANSETPARPRLSTPNLSVAAILSRLDIDGDGVPDNAPDTDGDGLPDNWEVGGLEALTASGDVVDRRVFYPAPSAIVPGTPPTPIFTRLAVATDALNPDTDGDGLSDFVEVFGLKFIDDNGNGLLDSNEWTDKNGDGLPSPGEFPIDNSQVGTVLLHDFDGFVFTDPTNPDTDGDGRKDGEDNDPLINPRAFGIETIIVRFNAEGNEDVDQDGLGNGMDMGNDLVSTDGPGVRDFEVIDNPENTQELLQLFRADLLGEGIIPESAIEDLLGADWDGNGLWRTTDVRIWSLVIDPADPARLPPADLFTVGDDLLYATQTFDELAALYNDDPNYKVYGTRGIGLGWQDLLEPSGSTDFVPDPRVWAILYAWRMPGFDIDGDGFIGVPNLSSTRARPSPENADVELATVALKRVGQTDTFTLANDVPIGSQVDRPFDDRIEFCDICDGANPQDEETGEPTLNGQIEPPPIFSGLSCGAFGMMSIVVMLLGLAVPRFCRRS